ncbi:MAG: biopolymer transporter ExbD [Bacteroidota bacterium]
MAEINQSTGRRAIKIDMTPMVDLAFLLLTFFMLTTTLLDRTVMEIRVPEEDPKSNPPPINQKKVVTLILGGDDKIYWYKGMETAINETDYSDSGIRKVLMELNASIKDIRVFIKPLDESKCENVVDILDEVMIVGVENYYLVDATKEEVALVKRSALKTH